MKTFKQIFTAVLLILTSIAFFGCDEEVYDMDEPGNLVPETVAEDPLLPRIEINGTIFHAETFGDINNPVIIFLHGGPGSDYRAMISQIGVENASRYPDERTITNGGLSQLQDEYFCVFYDQRGAGLSPRYDKGEVNFDLYVEDLDAIIDYYLNKKSRETGIQENQVYLFAWSYGGTLATGYINKHPEKVKDIAMYEPGPLTKEAYDYFIEHTTSPLTQIGKDWLEQYLLSHDHLTSDAHARADYQMLLGAFRSNPQFHENINCPLWRMGTLVSNEDLEKQNRDNTSNLSAFTGKMLFISGELTRKEYPGYKDIQMSCFPESEFIEVAGVGHTGPWEKPDEIATDIRNFFEHQSLNN
ncbi:alpha/beta fold hydrolase [Maribellus sediminis]|uniref:alpha/beta fold hydrolase n=1 Tax=Maribellus sediminis TaxID=2696285 RepID=UPI0014309259|nr:alpha/beta hydrolase [Maribellus sediminis]